MAVAAPAGTQSVLEPDERHRYADAIVQGCLRFEVDDTLFVVAEPAHRELAVALAEAAYRAGARLVDVRYLDPRLRAARVRYAREEYLGPVTAWGVRQARAELEPTSAVVTLLGADDPGVFDDLPPERLAQDAMRPLKHVKWYVRAATEGRRNWVGASWPTAYWAGQVYPGLESTEAQRRLAKDILWFCRLGPDDPPGFEGWIQHVESIAARARALTELDLDRVELRGPGTNLDLRLSPGTRWLGGQEVNGLGRLVAANIPTEECFTSPDARGIEGTFRCTRPLSFQNREIDGIAGEFRGGKLVRLEAATEADRDFLAAFLDSEPGAQRLGEVALVDDSSRIGQTGRTYVNSLIDENAVAHIAFGAGFGQTRLPDPGRRGARGVNRANLHLDVMIGAEELEATGIARDSRRLPLISDGWWAL
jgi:aminopeptidase